MLPLAYRSFIALGTPLGACRPEQKRGSKWRRRKKNAAQVPTGYCSCTASPSRCNAANVFTATLASVPIQTQATTIERGHSTVAKARTTNNNSSSIFLPPPFFKILLEFEEKKYSREYYSILYFLSACFYFAKLSSSLPPPLPRFGRKLPGSVKSYERMKKWNQAACFFSTFSGGEQHDEISLWASATLESSHRWSQRLKSDHDHAHNHHHNRSHRLRHPDEFLR